MKLFITSGIVLSLAAFSGAQEVKPSAQQIAQASEYQTVKPTVIPPMAETVKSVQPVAKPATAAPAPAKPLETKPAPKPVESVKPAVPAPAVKPAQPEAEAEKAAMPAADPGGGFAITRKHIVVKGETLWDLSDKYYKDPFKWGKIYTGNLDKISDPDRIYPGEEIFIPEITEIVRPSPKPGSSEATQSNVQTVTDMDAPDIEEGVAIPAGQAAASVPAVGKKADYGLLNKAPLEDISADMSEEMPEDLKEWSDSIKIAPAGWKPDGVITGVIKSDADVLPGSLTTSGEMVEIKAHKKGALKPGDIVTAYMKGAIAVDKNGEELGRELQKTGTLEVVSVEGSVVNARIVEAATSVDEDQLIVKQR